MRRVFSTQFIPNTLPPTDVSKMEPEEGVEGDLVDHNLRVPSQLPDAMHPKKGEDEGGEDSVEEVQSADMPLSWRPTVYFFYEARGGEG